MSERLKPGDMFTLDGYIMLVIDQHDTRGTVVCDNDRIPAVSLKTNKVQCPSKEYVNLNGEIVEPVCFVDGVFSFKRID
jgi:hypothetical protein